jgi:hypothetical protein
MTEKPASRSTWFRIRTVAAWGAIAAFVSFFAAQQVIGSMNPAGYHAPWPSLLPTPRSFETALWWRNLSLLFAVALALASLPRWQSILGLVLTVTYAAYCYFLFAMY